MKISDINLPGHTRLVNKSSSLKKTQIVKEFTIPVYKAASQMDHLGGSVKLVFYALLSYTSKKGLAWPNASNLAQRANVRPSNIKKYLQILVDSGLVQPVEIGKYYIPPMVTIQRLVTEYVEVDPVPSRSGEPGSCLQDPTAEKIPEADTECSRSTSRFADRHSIEGSTKGSIRKEEKPTTPPLNSSRNDIKKIDPTVGGAKPKAPEPPDPNVADVPVQLIQTFRSNSPSMRQILLDRCSKRARDLKSSSYSWESNCWDSESKRLEHRSLRQFISYGESYLYGIRISN